MSIGPLVSPEHAYEIGRACTAHDQPDLEPLSLDGWRGRLANPWPGRAVEHHVGLLGGDPVGLIELSFPQDDNLTTVNLELAVLPSARRRGVGRALLDLAVERARAEGRTHLIGPTGQRHPDGAAFARAAGAAPGLEAIDTFNAASNEHMLRINRAMGFQEVESVIEWQLTV